SLPTAAVESIAQSFGCCWSLELPPTFMARIDKADIELVRQAFRTLLADSLAHPIDRGLGRCDLVELNELLRLLVRCAIGNKSVLSVDRNTERERIVKSVVEMIRDKEADGVVTIAELCRRAKTSERTLHYAFMERYGLPPGRFIKAFRLSQVK